MKITDGRITVVITMKEKSLGKWPIGNYAFDFFDCGGLKQDDNGAYIVSDVDYCICLACEWAYRCGDFIYDEIENERMVDVIELY